jgi:glycosyltransferase involved in cell wall biosynthesis
MNVALVHESLTHLGGAERVLRELHGLFPDAPIYALHHDEEVVRELLPNADVRLSFLRKFPRFMRRRERLLLPLLPVAPETFDLSDFDVVISSASAFAKGVVTRPGTLHLCYCHSPTRYLWDWYPQIFRERNMRGIKRAAVTALLHGLRLWDQSAARRVDLYVTNSQATRARIRKYYGRDAAVIHPPVDIERFTSQKDAVRRPAAAGIQRDGYFLVVSRLSPYKRTDLVVNTFNKLELPLVVIGSGSEERKLRRLAGPTVSVRGFVPDSELPRWYAGARAVIFAPEDDFGIVPVEAMASGTPVLAFRGGGALETVVEGVTGEFFDEPVEAFLAEAVRRFLEKERHYDSTILRRHAEQFSRSRFRATFMRFLEKAWDQWQRRGSGPFPPAGHRTDEVFGIAFDRIALPEHEHAASRLPDR